MTALNFLVTIITMRAPGMTFFRMPLLVWANFSTSLLVVIATPFIAVSQFMVLFDRVMGFNFFEPVRDGDVLMYQHIFWFYSHPAVYIMMLPGFGIISEILAVMSRKPIFGYRMMAFSLLAIVVLGFTVWAHHMFVSGMQDWIRVPMMVTTAIIAVPTGIKIFSWLATLWRGVLHLDTPMLFALGFLTMFTLGGISGVMLAIIPVTIHVSDTYFIVAHIHYVLFGGSLFTIFAGVYYWFPKMTGRMYDERLGKLHFWSTFVFFNLTFAPMHVIGIQGMPRRVADYAEQWATWNLMISIASFFLGLSALVFAYNMIASWRGGPIAESNPWNALTLEWQVTSPPPIFNFDAIPTVVGGPYEYGVPGCGAWRPQQGRRRCPATGRRHRARRRARRRHDRRGGSLMAHIVVVANQTIAGAKLLDLVRERAQAARHELHARRADDEAPLGLRHLRRRGARLRPGAPRPDAVLSARRGRRRQRRARRRGPVHGHARRGRRVPPRRGHHLDASALVLGLAAARPHRAHPGRRSRPGHARRSRTWTPTGSPSRSRSSSPTSRPAAATCARA